MPNQEETQYVPRRGGEGMIFLRWNIQDLDLKKEVELEE